MKKETLLSDCPLVIGNYLKEIHIVRWEEKDTEPEVTVVKKTRKKRMSKRQRESPMSTRRHSKRHIQEVVLAADNGEVVKETQLLDSHEDVE
nr:hypothetical protein [Tanacetum cinerariifolium]